MIGDAARQTTQTADAADPVDQLAGSRKLHDAEQVGQAVRKTAENRENVQ